MLLRVDAGFLVRGSMDGVICVLWFVWLSVTVFCVCFSVSCVFLFQPFLIRVFAEKLVSSSLLPV